MTDTLPTVTVSSGLTFRCPHCDAEGHRAGPGSDVYAVPPGHEVHETQGRTLVRCFEFNGGDWWLVFADVPARAPRSS